MDVCGRRARITDERAGSFDRNHTSPGVFVAIDSNLGAVVGAEEGAIDVHPRKRRNNCTGVGKCAVEGCECLAAVHFWHTEGMVTKRMKPILDAVFEKSQRPQRHP